MYLTGAATAGACDQDAAAMTNVIFMNGSLKNGRRMLPAGAFSLPAAAGQLFDQAIAMIALDLDAAVLGRPAEPQRFLSSVASASSSFGGRPSPV